MSGIVEDSPRPSALQPHYTRLTTPLGCRVDTPRRYCYTSGMRIWRRCESIRVVLLRISTIKELVFKLLEQQEKIMADFTKLNAAVVANTTAVDAAIVKIDALIAGGADQASIDAAATTVQADADRLAAKSV